MNAADYLKGHGWRGEGFSLDTTNRGLAKPLLVQRKEDAVGLGAKKHDFSNQWWLSSFDKSLSAIGIDGAAVKPAVVAPKFPVIALGASSGYLRSGLYSTFVRGEILSSTIDTDASSSSTASSPSLINSPPPKMSSMSTVGAGFVLGESPAQSLAMSSGAPVVSNKVKKDKEKKSKRKRTGDEEVAGTTTQIAEPDESRDSKKPKVREDLADEEQRKKEKKEKKERKERRRKEGEQEALLANGEVKPTDAVPVASATPVAAVAEDVAAAAEAAVDKKTARKLQAKEEKAERKAIKVQIKAEAAAAAEKEAGIAAATNLPPAEATTIVPSVENGVELQSDFIALGGDADGQEDPHNSKPLPPKVKPMVLKKKKKGGVRMIFKNPDGTIDAFAIDPHGAPGGNKLMHVPTVHPKTGAVLTKKARKIIGKKLVKVGA